MTAGENRQPARSEVPIACSLSLAALGRQARAWQSLLSRALVDRQRVPGGIRLTLRPGSGEALAELVRLERECCPWITFELSDATVTMTAEGAGEEVLLATFV
jgi:hypothetical protein